LQIKQKLILIIALSIICVNGVHADDNVQNEKNKRSSEPLDIKFAIGGSLSTGNNSTRTASIDTELDKRYVRFRLRVNGKGTYGETSYSDGPWIESTNNWRVTSRVDWFTSSSLHSFLFAEGGMQSNQYRGFWLKNSVQGGYGLRLFSNSDFIDLGLPIGFDYSRDVLVVDNGQKPETFSGVIKPEIEIKFNDNIRYRLKTNIFMDFRDEEDYKIESDNTIDMKVTEVFSLRLQYLLNHNNKPRLIRELGKSGSETGERVPAKPTDHLLSTSIVLSF